MANGITRDVVALPVARGIDEFASQLLRGLQQRQAVQRAQQDRLRQEERADMLRAAERARQQQTQEQRFQQVERAEAVDALRKAAQNQLLGRTSRRAAQRASAAPITEAARKARAQALQQQAAQLFGQPLAGLSASQLREVQRTVGGLESFADMQPAPAAPPRPTLESLFADPQFRETQLALARARSPEFFTATEEALAPFATPAPVAPAAPTAPVAPAATPAPAQRGRLLEGILPDLGTFEPIPDEVGAAAERAAAEEARQIFERQTRAHSALRQALRKNLE